MEAVHGIWLKQRWCPTPCWRTRTITPESWAIRPLLGQRNTESTTEFLLSDIDIRDLTQYKCAKSQLIKRDRNGIIYSPTRMMLLERLFRAIYIQCYAKNCREEYVASFWSYIEYLTICKESFSRDKFEKREQIAKQYSSSYIFWWILF